MSEPHSKRRRVEPHEVKESLEELNYFIDKSSTAQHQYGLNPSVQSVYRVLQKRTSSTAPLLSRSRAAMLKHCVPTHLVSQHVYDGSVYCNQFSKSGNTLCCATQDGTIHIYDTSNIESWRRTQRIRAQDMRWSIIDVDYSPDERFVIYSSWSPYVSLTNVGGHQLHELLPVANEFVSSCMFGIRFSPDNRYVLAGMNMGIMTLHDIERKRNVIDKNGHDDDINAVCFVDDNPSVFLTAGDDCAVKMWDTRARGIKCCGVLIGHSGGLTSVASKGDGRYILTNGKDSCMKLWDLRHLLSPRALDETEQLRSHQHDYRFAVQRRSSSRLPDCSLKTYADHTVFRTLMRCDFSPLYSTGQAYGYVASADGSVCVYDLLSGDLKQDMGLNETVLRQASWHPFQPVMTAGGMDATLSTFSVRPAPRQTINEASHRPLDNVYAMEEDEDSDSSSFDGSSSDGDN